MTMSGRLQTVSDGETEVAISMEVSVIGRLAQFGSRLMEDVSNRMFDQFVTCFQRKLEADIAPTSASGPAESAAGPAAGPTSAASTDDSSIETEPEPIEALPLLFSVLGSAISRFLGRLFGRQQDK